jgi:hypothetical protein
MNKKTNRSSLRAPTVNPASSIAPSATLAEDGELPLSASNGVSAPAPLAAHDVLQAAMAPREGAPADADADAAPKRTQWNRAHLRRLRHLKPAPRTQRRPVN